MVSRTLLAAALTAIAACDGPGFVDRDEPEADALSLALAPAVSIETHDGEPIHGIKSIAVKNDYIAVAEGSSDAVLVYQLDGKLVRVVGRKGAGPGEFMGLSDVFYLSGDSLLAFDSELRRFQVFDDAGNYAREFFLSAEHGRRLSSTLPVGIVDSRYIVVQQIRDLDEESTGLVRAQIAVLLFTSTGALIDTVAVVSGWEAYTTEVNGVVFANMPVPFGNSTYISAADGSIALASTDSNELRLYSSSGELTGVRSTVAPLGRELTAADVRERLERAVASAPASMKNQLAAVYDEMPLPSRRPPFTWVYAGEDGSSWLNLGEAEDGSQRFKVFAPGSEDAIGLVSVPADLDVARVSLQSIVGIWRDSLGVESIRMYKLDR